MCVCTRWLCIIKCVFVVVVVDTYRQAVILMQTIKSKNMLIKNSNPESPNTRLEHSNKLCATVRVCVRVCVSVRALANVCGILKLIYEHERALCVRLLSVRNVCAIACVRVFI